MSFNFTEYDAVRALEASEGQFDFNGRHRGHARERHVAITKADLSDRMWLGGATKVGMPVYTAFVSVWDQARAVAAAFNAPEAAALMNKVFHPSWREWFAPGDSLQVEDIPLATPIPVRMATGGDGPAMWPGDFATVYFSICPGRPRDLHIVTAFAAPFRNPAKPPRKLTRTRDPAATRRHHHR